MLFDRINENTGTVQDTENGGNLPYLVRKHSQRHCFGAQFRFFTEGFLQVGLDTGFVVQFLATVSTVISVAPLNDQGAFIELFKVLCLIDMARRKGG